MKKSNSQTLKSYIRNLGIELVGIADLNRLRGMPLGIPSDSPGFLKKYDYAIVFGAQFGKLGTEASANDVSVFLEKTALEVAGIFLKKGYASLTIHTEDEYDSESRTGLMSLKVLAKRAGLGWQGRSLLIISPDFGPIHRLIAILTNMPLQPDAPLLNQCGECSKCIEACPVKALTLIRFDDHPEKREDVLNIQTCRGDYSCDICITVCPWLKRKNSRSQRGIQSALKK